ncbi:dihydrodipicolinate synthase family protein [Infirmifilum lucidum]|uniref:Dihydrodipicolinate synthase family protein n=1 Tax=Infirmifilum lucidum TaxID=2776706 RepID=A0A7L9FJI9_9CREN|nr:dihydrodipicolinate synthase family protein [Infirmifilum lucidum]QOJ79183.1 dihydrodipicolinate synthase family protein [Infirmifilum lucidum]
MMGTKLFGIIPPLLTPFDSQGKIDFEALGQLLDFTKPYVHGYYVCGTYGQGPLMSVEERKKVVEKVIERMTSSKYVVVHVGSTSTEVAVELAKHSEQVGARAVASVPPFYYRHTEEAVVEFFRELVNSTDLPVYVYNNPPRVGYPVTPELAAKLKEVGVAGVKDSSFDVLTYINYKLFAGEEFDVIVGTEALMLPTWVLGARSFIPGMSNYLPEIVYELFKTLEEGDFEKARVLQFRINKLREELHRLGSPISIAYTVLRVRGIKHCYPKKPLLPARGGQEESIKRLLEEYLRNF